VKIKATGESKLEDSPLYHVTSACMLLFRDVIVLHWTVTVGVTRILAMPYKIDNGIYRKGI